MSAVQYVLLPVLAQSLGLSYTQVGILRAAKSTAMACFEIPSGFLADKFGERNLLAAGLFGVGVGYIGVANSSQFITLIFCFLLAGFGAAFQHSLSSALLVKRFEGGLRRKALGTYNTFGDLGKLAYTGAFSLLIGMGLAWNTVALILAISAIGFGLIVWVLLSDNLPPQKGANTETAIASGSDSQVWGISDRAGFSSLSVVVFLDSIVQAAFLTFIGFVLLEKGASADHAAGGVVLTLIGGTVGKFAGGLLAAKIGDRKSFSLVQALTMAGLFAVWLLPLQLVFIVLPLVGVVVQGSSTVCYGMVADFADEQKSSRAYSLIYTLSSAGSMVGPFFLGMLADHVHLNSVLWALTLVTALTLIFGMSFSDSKHSRTYPPAF